MDHIAAAGFNAVMTDAYGELLDARWARGLRGVVWLGWWDNGSCSWEHDDAWITEHVRALAGHPGVLAYYLGDEPSFGSCPGGPAAFRARTALVHALDPGRPTFTVIMTWDEAGQEEFPYGRWVGAVDILGLDVYPCVLGYSQCSYELIDQAVAAATRAGVPRYWAVVQDFQDDYHRLPAPAEIAAQFDRWNHSNMAGYFVFSWNYGAIALDTVPENVAMLRQQNALHGGPS